MVNRQHTREPGGCDHNTVCWFICQCQRAGWVLRNNPLYIGPQHRPRAVGQISLLDYYHTCFLFYDRHVRSPYNRRLELSGTKDRMALIESIRNGRNLGGDYLLRHLGEDGTFPSRAPAVADYYKALTAFQVCGHNRASNTLCKWIRQQGQLENGDFVPRPEAGNDASTYIYFKAWIIIGAHRLGQFDLAR